MILRLFTPFMQADTTLDRGRGGLGLGLALSKGLVKLHGGDITAYSPGLNKGSEFVVYLPLEQPLTEESEAPSQCNPHHSRQVLIIDDNVDIADSLCELLELNNHKVAVAYSGPEGLTKAREFHPEILLCDIGLPGMNGYDIARAFRRDEELKNTFLVALTGYALPKDLQQAADAGFQCHLAKPVDLAELDRILTQFPDRFSGLTRIR